MKEILLNSILQASPLFRGIEKENINGLLACIGTKIKTFNKAETIIFAGNSIDFVGIMLKGSAKITKESYDGKENIIAKITTGECFGEAFAFAEITQSPISVVCLEPCEVLFLNCKKIITSCSNSCQFHTKLVENMLNLIAQKNIMLNQKIDILSKRTIRKRLLLYFSFISGGKKTFTVPLSREALAAYLCVDRSALSNEISKLKTEKLIEINKSKITFL